MPPDDQMPQIDEVEWSLLKGKHETPCCQQAVRVKLVEPGPQNRKCSLCKTVNVFVLEPMQSSFAQGKLKLRWLTDSEVAAMNAVEGDLSIEDL